LHLRTLHFYWYFFYKSVSQLWFKLFATFVASYIYIYNLILIFFATMNPFFSFYCEKLVKHAHEKLGHFWVCWTYSLLQTQYWWWRMQLKTQQFVFWCLVCNHIQASFNAPTPHLQQLPIIGLGYWWSLDFVGPFNLTIQHNQYVFVIIEHFSKWQKLMPLPNRSSESITYAILDMVFNRFDTLVEVPTNQSTKFHGEF
jgi:hypothetical protein